MTVPASLLADLRALLGPSGYLEAAGDVEPYVSDHRQLYRGATPMVVRPASTEEVSGVMRLCHQHGVGVVPVGGNTSYCGGATPSADGSQIVLSLARMKRIRQVDADNYTLIAEAGCVLATIQDAAAAVDRLFPMSLGSEGSCQLGGNLSTNAGGTAVLRYGVMRELVLGLEVVLPDGRVLDALQPLRKDNTGYDLRDLFIGAEGTLGIITAATCKLFSRPASHFTAFIGLDSPDQAVALLSRMRSFTGDAVSTFELIPRFALQLVLDHIEGTRDPLGKAYNWYVLMEIGLSQHAAGLHEPIAQALGEAMEAGVILDAALANSESQRELFWKLRESIPPAQRYIGASIKHDVSVATSELPRFILEASAEVHAIVPDGRIVSYGHLGDGNLHFNISRPIDGDDAAFMTLAPRIHRAIHDLIARYGGSISAEHGIGQLKREELLRYKSPVAIELMRAIKQAIDPRGIMNPGKVL